MTARDSRTRWASSALVGLFLALATGIVAVGVVSFGAYARHARVEVERQLSAIAELKVNELVQWRHERLGDGATLFANPVFSTLVRRTLGDPRDIEAHAQLQVWLQRYLDRFAYDQVRLLDALGEPCLTLPAGQPQLSAVTRTLIPEVLRSGKVTFQDFYRNEPTGLVHLAVLVPILDDRDGTSPLGVLILRIDPETYLYPFLQTWPIPSSTAETLLVRRDGDEAVFLNELRFRKQTALTLRAPLTRTTLPASLAASGREGVVDGVDYRGVSVLAALRQVPGSPWALVARIDRSELDASIRARMWLVVLVVGALLASVGAGIGLLWRQQIHSFERHRLRALQEQAWLQEVIARSLNEVYVFDPDTLHFLFVNAGALRNTGRSGEEMASLTPSDISPEFSGERLGALLQPLLTGEREVLTVETVHRRKDGSDYPVETHLQLVDVPDGKVFLAVVSDISERRQAEQTIRATLQRYHDLLSHQHYGILVIGADNTVEFANQLLCDQFSLTVEPRTLIGLTAEAMVARMLPAYADPDQTLASIRSVLANGVPVTDLEVRFRGGQTFLVDYYPLILDGQPAGRMWQHRDVTDRTLADEALKAERSRFTAVFESSAAGMSLTGVDGVLHRVNRAFADMLGYSAEELSTRSFASLTHPDDVAESRECVRTLIAGEKHTYRMRKRYLHSTGRIVWAEVSTTLLRDPAGHPLHFITNVVDITERKLAEDAFRALSSRQEAILYAVPDIIMEVDTEKIYTWANPAGIAFFGDGVIGREAVSFFEGEQTTYQVVQPIFDGRDDTVYVESWQRRKDGEKRLLAWWCRVLKDADGRPTGALSTGRDITERRAAEEELAQSKRLLQDITDNASALIYTVDTEGRFLFVNRRSEAVLGAEQEQVIGKTRETFLPAEVAALHRANDLEIIRSRQAQLFEEENTGPHGREVYLTVKFPLFDRQGRLYAVGGMSTDITERKIADEELRRTRDFLDNLITHANAPIIVWDANGRITRFNRAFEEISGLKADQVMGQGLDLLFAENRRDRAMGIVARASAGERFDLVEVPILHTSGSQRVVLWNSAPILAPDGQTQIATIAQGQDITERTWTETALRESEEKFSKAFQTSPYAITITRPEDGSFVEVNDAFTSMTGFTREEALADSSVGLKLWANGEDRQRIVASLRAGQPVVGQEYQFRTKSGEIITGLFSAHAILLGQESCILSSINDISERKRAQTQAEQLMAMVVLEKERLSALVKSLPDEVWFADTHGQFTLANPTALKEFCLDPEAEVDVQTLASSLEVLRSDGTPRPLEEAPPLRALAGEMVTNQEEIVRTPATGELRYRLVNAAPVRDATGITIGAISVVRDITDRRRAEEALRDSEERFHALFDSMAEGVALHEIVFDEAGAAADYRILDLNPAYQRHTGLVRERAVGRLGTETYGTVTPPYLEEFSRVALGGEPFSFETYFPPLDRHFSISVTSPRHGQFATIFEDITERKHWEAELTRKNDELERFTYTISHDLKSPLVTVTTFLGYLEGDLARGDADRVRQDTRFIRTAAEKMSQLLGELLEMSRIGRVINPPVDTSFREIVVEALSLVAGGIAERGVEIVVSEGEIPLTGDRPRLVEIWQNLIENAVKFSGGRPAPRVEIGVEGVGSEVVFFVRDNGIGLDPRFQSKVFTLFEKLDPSSPGTGLGLALVKRIVDLDGGRIWVESPGVGHGACFRFTLPNAIRASAAKGDA